MSKDEGDETPSSINESTEKFIKIKKANSL